MRQFTEYVLVNPFTTPEKEQAKILTKWLHDAEKIYVLSKSVFKYKVKDDNVRFKEHVITFIIILKRDEKVVIKYLSFSVVYNVMRKQMYKLNDVNSYTNTVLYIYK
ncbi:MAG: hypothetical protein QXV17_09680 [Candidatus Micrarchaeaceae archaeon]